MPAASLSKVYNWAFVVDEQELRRLFGEMAGALEAGTAFGTFTVRLSDGSDFTTGSIEDVLKEENHEGRTMSGLSVRVFNKEQRDMTVAIGDVERVWTRNHLTVEGDARDWVDVTFSKLEHRIQRMRVSRPEAVVAIVGTGLIVFFFFVLKQLAWRYQGALFQPTNVDGNTTLNGVGLLVFAGFPVAIFVVMIAIVVWLYPPVTFRIGDGVARHDRLVRIEGMLSGC